MDMGYKQLRVSLFFSVFTVLILVLAGVLDAELGDKHSPKGHRGNYNLLFPLTVRQSTYGISLIIPFFSKIPLQFSRGRLMSKKLHKSGFDTTIRMDSGVG